MVNLAKIKCMFGIHNFVYEYSVSHPMPRRQCSTCGLLQINSRIDYKWETIGKFNNLGFKVVI